MIWEGEGESYGRGERASIARRFSSFLHFRRLAQHCLIRLAFFPKDIPFSFVSVWMVEGCGYVLWFMFMFMISLFVEKWRKREKWVGDRSIEKCIVIIE